MIVTVTLNPTLDKTLSVSVLRPGEVHRARFLRQDIGGKGINVSRALAALGVASIPIGFLGGATGRAMRDGLAAQGYDARFVEVPGETRQNLTLLDESTGVYTKINEPGPTIGPEHLAALHALVAELVAPGDLWALCGSLPPGAPAGLLRRPGDCSAGARRAGHPRHQRGWRCAWGWRRGRPASNRTARKRPKLWVKQ